MKKFYVAVISAEENGAGILKENERAVRACGLSGCCDIEAVAEKFKIGKISASGSSATVTDGMVYLDKRENPDIIFSVRLALCFGAEGVIIPFGNNKNRPYVKEGRAYTTKEMVSAVGELKRLAPLFNREFADLGAIAP